MISRLKLKHKHVFEIFFFQSNQNELVDVESTSDLPIFVKLEETMLSDRQNERKKKATQNDSDADDSSVSKLETTIAQVMEKFRKGCDCQTSCFLGLIPEAVFRHRLNVTELTREEHDMYLMGVIMACLSNPKQTIRNKERQRQRASYAYHGKRVCVDAFTYLENVTIYHLKRIRRHVLTQGVVPRVHGNMGKKPHNTFSLDMYKCAEHFIKQTLAQHTTASGPNAFDTTKLFVLAGETRSSVYNKFKQSGLHPGGKVMGYTTFGHFLKKQFPNVRFVKDNVATGQGKAVRRQHQQQQSQTRRRNVHSQVKVDGACSKDSDYVYVVTSVTKPVVQQDAVTLQDPGYYEEDNILRVDEDDMYDEIIIEEDQS